MNRKASLKLLWLRETSKRAKKKTPSEACASRASRARVCARTTCVCARAPQRVSEDTVVTLLPRRVGARWVCAVGVLCGCGRRAHHNVPEESVGTLLSHQLELTRELLEEGERLRPAVEGLGGASEGALQLTRALVQRNHHALLVLERARRVRRARGGSRHPS